MPTQVERAKRLGINQSNVSRQMSDIGIDYKNLSLDEVTIAYCNHLRKVAGQVSFQDEEINGAKEKALKDRAERQLMELKLAEAQGILVNVASIEEKYSQRVEACKAEFIATAEKIKTMTFTVYGVDVDISYLNEYINAALTHLAGSGDSGEQGTRSSVLPIPSAGKTDDHPVGKKASGNKRKSKRDTGKV